MGLRAPLGMCETVNSVPISRARARSEAAAHFPETGHFAGRAPGRDGDTRAPHEASSVIQRDGFVVEEEASHSLVQLHRQGRPRQEAEADRQGHPGALPGRVQPDRMGPGYHSPAQLRERGHLLRPKQGGQDRAELPKAG